MQRREFLGQALATGMAIGGLAGQRLQAQDGFGGVPDPGERPQQDPRVEVRNPAERVPVSFIIDDSTCLVNLAHFCIPQFAEVFPDRYRQNWRALPREIPDSFVRKFGEWCREHGVKGKYSVVPYPACVGWMDRDLPGWTRRELRDSLALVRDFLTPDWDIHPEMVSHTWVINPKTGRPYEERSERFMENWGWSVGRSAEELTEYLAYSLKILKNVDLPCEGVTTPGGFGNRARRALSQATLESCRDVYRAEIPHYFRHLYTDDRSVAPRVENAAGLNSDDPRCVVSIIGCTGDWFGGWDGLTLGSSEQFITADLEGGRLPEVIDRGEPAVLVCHWPGIYFNGLELGFQIFQTVVDRLHRRYDHLTWMKLSEISRYWAARELTTIQRAETAITLRAPFAASRFTLRFAGGGVQRLELVAGRERTELTRVPDRSRLAAGTCLVDGDGMVTACFDLPKGASQLVWR